MIYAQLADLPLRICKVNVDILNQIVLGLKSWLPNPKFVIEYYNSKLNTNWFYKTTNRVNTYMKILQNSLNIHKNIKINSKTKQ